MCTKSPERFGQPETTPTHGRDARGYRDYYASHDLEDLFAVVDDIASAAPRLRACVTEAITTLAPSADFTEVLPGHLPADRASQGRPPGPHRKLARISALAK